MDKKITIRLLSNNTTDDQETFKLLKSAEIPFEVFGPTSGDPTPVLFYKGWEFHGLEEVKNFIEGWKTGNLPPLKIL